MILSPLVVALLVAAVIFALTDMARAAQACAVVAVVLLLVGVLV